jgi:hypothetical protein
LKLGVKLAVLARYIRLYLLFKAVLAIYEQLLKNYDSVNYNSNGAPKDYLLINLRAAWAKLNAYYTKLNDSPVYFAATCLYLYY